MIDKIINDLDKRISNQLQLIQKTANNDILRYGYHRALEAFKEARQIVESYASEESERKKGMKTGLKDKNGTEIKIGDKCRLILDGEVRDFMVEYKTVRRTVKSHPDFADEEANVNITGVVFTWDGYNTFLCVDENGIGDNEKMEIIND